jgi:hypothetical protein
VAELKTKPNKASVKEFIDSIEDEQKRKDCRAIMKIMKAATGASPRMWGTDIVGYGSYHFKYASGREGDWFQAGFSPRKQNLTLYIMSGFRQHDRLMKQLGKYSTGKSCLYIKRLSDVDSDVLTKLIEGSVRYVSGEIKGG